MSLLKVSLSVHLCVCSKMHGCVCVHVYQFIRHFLRLFFPNSASQAVGAEGNCGGRELVRAVSLGDVNMAMLSWHRT